MVRVRAKVRLKVKIRVKVRLRVRMPYEYLVWIFIRSYMNNNCLN